MKRRLKAFLRLIGKQEHKIAMVFGRDPERCHRTVVYIRHGEPNLAVWLFCLTDPLPETVPLCQRIHVNPGPAALLWRAYRQGWRYWVVLGATSWAGRPGRWLLKLAPFCIPPFRALI